MIYIPYKYTALKTPADSTHCKYKQFIHFMVRWISCAKFCSTPPPPPSKFFTLYLPFDSFAFFRRDAQRTAHQKLFTNNVCRSCCSVKQRRQRCASLFLWLRSFWSNDPTHTNTRKSAHRMNEIIFIKSTQRAGQHREEAYCGFA